MGWTLVSTSLLYISRQDEKVSPCLHFDHASLALPSAFAFFLTSEENVKHFQKCVHEIILFRGDSGAVIMGNKATQCEYRPGCY